MKVLVVGMGYIGLPTAVILANQGVQVAGYDTNQEKIQQIQQGETPIVEDGLNDLLKKALDEKKLTVSSTLTGADVFVIAVPTPINRDSQADLTHVQSAIDAIAPHLKEGSLIILESTCPVGTTDILYDEIKIKMSDTLTNIHMAYCPERVLPGNIIKELRQNARIIGGVDEVSKQKAIDFYKLFVKGELNSTDAKTAELCKLTENSYRDVCIAFANELSRVCDIANLDVQEVINFANLHPRVNILQPGIGVGGHCIAVDPWFIISDFPEITKLLRKARQVNQRQTAFVISKIKKEIHQYKKRMRKDPKIACLGLAFKPNVDDLRGSPAVEIAYRLLEDGYMTYFVEPNIQETNVEIEVKNEKNIPVKKIIVLSTLEDIKEYADLVFLLVAHSAYQKEIENNTFGNRLHSYVSYAAKS